MNTIPMVPPEDDVVRERFRRRLPESAPARERVAWLGRDDTRARGECLAPGSFVLAHPRFPHQFRADDARNWDEFREHGFTWTEGAAEALASVRWDRLPAQGGRGPRDPLGARDWALTQAWVSAGSAALRRNLGLLAHDLRGATGYEARNGLRELECHNLSETWLAAWEREAREPGMRAWPVGFREACRRLNHVEVHRLATSDGHTFEVAVACLTPLVLAFRPAIKVDDPSEMDGLRIEWRPFDGGLVALFRQMVEDWRRRQNLPAPSREYLFVGLDIRHTAVPTDLAPLNEEARWQGFWAQGKDGALSLFVPSNVDTSEAERAILRRLSPESWDQTVERVQREVERLRADLFRGTMSVRRLTEALRLPSDTVLQALRTLEQAGSTGGEGIALRRLPGVRGDDPSNWEVVRPDEKAPALALLTVRPVGWVRSIWLVYAAVASATLSYFVGKWVGDGNPPAWKAIGVAVVLSGVATLLRRWAERRAGISGTVGGPS